MLKDKLREYWHWPVIILVVFILVIFRLTSYGDPSLSIGSNDSSSYFDQVNVPTFSWEALTVRRLPSYVLFFKLFEPSGGFHLQAVNYPAAPGVGTSNKIFQPGFDKVVLSQMWLSILAWTFFSLTVARHLKTRWLKVLAVGLILVFAFLPPVAEWDSILMSESGTFSLFMLILGITIEVIARVIQEGPKITPATTVWGLAWLVVFLLWAFMRDSNANILIIPAALLLVLLAIPTTRRRLPIWPAAGLAFFLLAIFAIYATAAAQSGRWMGSWNDLYYGYIKPYPDHVQFFRDHGMPTSNIEEWASENGAKTYVLMMLNFPRFAINMFIYQLQDVFSENLQTYFFTLPSTGYRTMLAFGDMFHPLSSSVFPLGILSGVLVIAGAFKSWMAEKRVWGWTALVMLLLVYGYYGFAFFGDSAGLIRHLLGAVMPMRLMVWLFPVVLADFALRKTED